MFYNIKADQPFLHDLHWDGILHYRSHCPLSDFIALSTRVLGSAVAQW